MSQVEGAERILSKLVAWGAGRDDLRAIGGEEILHVTFEGGTNTVAWNGTGSGGETLASGIYFVRMDVAGERDSRRVVLLK